MRINRDIRFSKDKTPYKTNLFAFINRDGKKSPLQVISLAFNREIIFGAGIYMPEGSVLNKIVRKLIIT